MIIDQDQSIAAKAVELLAAASVVARPRRQIELGRTSAYIVRWLTGIWDDSILVPMQPEELERLRKAIEVINPFMLMKGWKGNGNG